MLIGARLRQLRLARDLSLDDLAREMGGIVTKQALSKYEGGKSQPSHVVLNKLASALGVKASSLAAEPAIGVEFHGFRKRARLGKREQESIQSWVKQLLEDRARLQSLFNVSQLTPLPFHSFVVSSLEDIEDAAMGLRRTWSLGSAPIADVTNTLEDWRVHVIEIPDHERFDGLSATVSNEQGEIVAGAVIISSQTSGERQRFNLAHELGHLVMKMAKKLDKEAAANRFAGAFLAPSEALISTTGQKRHHISQQELMLLKEKFRMSIQALLYRMMNLGIISETYHKQWCVDINRLGWRKNEPGELPREQPNWLRRTILQAITEDLMTKEEAERILGESIDSEEPLTLKQRRDFIKLPLEERRAIMAKQARELAEHYNTDPEWREGEGGAIIED